MLKVLNASRAWRAADGVAVLASAVALVVLAACGILMAIALAGARHEAVLHADRIRSEAISYQLGEIAEDVAAVSLWTEAYDHIAQRLDQAWLAERFAARFRGHRRHELTLVRDARDRSIYATLDGRALDPEAQASLARGTERFASGARADAAARRARWHAADGEEAQGHAEGALRLGDKVYLLAAATVTPEAGSRRRALAGLAPVVISGVAVDQGLFDEIERAFQQRNLSLSVSGSAGPGRTALRGPDGEVVATLTGASAPIAAGGLTRLRGWIEGVGAVGLAIVILLVALLRRQAQAAEAAREHAQAGERAKSEFIANISHEIRTPLNGVLGMAQVMQAGELSDEQRGRLHVVQESGETLLALLNDVLEFSKMEAGKLTLVAGEFDAEELARRVCATFEGMAAAKDLSVVLKVDPCARGAWVGDALRIRQMLSNLMSNAVKFTADGSVTLALERVAEGLRFSVHDTGIGVEAAKIPELFEQFSQGDPTATRRYGGTGLGLSITRGLLRLMGGEIAVSSRPGEGSCFALTLPLKRATRSIQEIATPVLVVPEKPALAARPRILAAEDNLTNQYVLRALLDPLDLDLTLAANGREAVDAFDGQAFDVVLMDVQMPELNGIDATLAIRRMEAERGLPPTPIFAMTANVMEHQLESYRAAGMDGYLAKPLDVSALYATLDRALNDEPQAPATAWVAAAVA